MVKINVLIILLIALGSIHSCRFLSSGYDNEYGQFVPKHPHYWLKDKKNHKTPKNLDTINIYKQHYTFDQNGMELSYPVEFYVNPEVLINLYYLKFYSNGRCASFGTTLKGVDYRDLYPKNSNFTKGYYYSKGDMDICIERFTYGESLGDYIRWKYVVSSEGDTIKRISKNKVRSIYVRELLPKDWKKYPVDW